MAELRRALLSFVVIAPAVAVASGASAIPPGIASGSARSSAGEDAKGKPPKAERSAPERAEQGPPLAAELEKLKRAVTARDADAVAALLSPDGVECGDYLYGRAEYDLLVRRPDGKMRPWLFGTGAAGDRSVRTYLESVTPFVTSDSATHRTATFRSAAGPSLDIGYTLADGRWLISEGLFCE